MEGGEGGHAVGRDNLYPMLLQYLYEKIRRFFLSGPAALHKKGQYGIRFQFSKGATTLGAATPRETAMLVVWSSRRATQNVSHARQGGDLTPLPQVLLHCVVLVSPTVKINQSTRSYTHARVAKTPRQQKRLDSIIVHEASRVRRTYKLQKARFCHVPLSKGIMV